MKSPIEWSVCVEKPPRENPKKIAKVRYCGGCGGNVYRDVNRGVGRFCRQACLLMYPSNVDLQCCIVPPLRGTDRGTIENYPRLHCQGIAKYPLIWWWGGYLPLPKNSIPAFGPCCLSPPPPRGNAAPSSGCPLAPPLASRLMHIQ